ncbi:MAG: tetratricopeptide repeat protein, partial [Candidatus Sericytochromatia bacterium]
MPSNPSLLHHLSLLIQASELDQAWQLCQSSLLTAPNDPELQVIWGYLNLEKGQAAEAAAAFHRALALGAQDPKLTSFLAQACRVQGDWQGVIHWEKTYFEQVPEDLDALLRIGEAHLHLNAPGQALARFHKAVELAFKRGDFAGAAQTLQGVLQLFPGHPELRFLQAKLLLQQGQSAAAQALIAELYLAKVATQKASPLAQTESLMLYAYEFEHHLAQLNYLLEKGVFAREQAAEYTALLAQWQEMATQFNGQNPFQCLEISGKGLALLKQPYYLPALPTFKALLHPDLDLAAVEAAFLGQNSGIVVLEPLLRPEVVAALYDYCLSATIWHQAYATGYLGCSWRDGFYPALLFQLAEELQTALPNIFKQHRLTNLWSFKCDQRGRGTGVHGDEAALNLNLWVTPTVANLKPEAGGLIIYDKAAPVDWAFNQYNQADQIPLIYDFLKRSQAQPHRIAYRQNRAVLFSSNLFHEADQLVFAPGFVNMRLNITLLFGTRPRYTPRHTHRHAKS